ncbi:alcohol dehydrogenase, putative [Phytophthora infestans T30-4]|uniref:Alcohol dehydrogenase, putative n=1 Tax=Phytophthora infestans (strain T30-4) TaxID=403677 RepID=D0N2I2_PHYIT|nr:alcohol dehydrogenase, putative [Phytophthora infestans T30-4]EEY68511.1 alcohol dehydrogenase, putative [Phytophthora infestans T30-4]|eukprot:XP_002905670.1 alcohol dehydrogenase, putative [Phytophthora infestans T30-4]
MAPSTTTAQVDVVKYEDRPVPEIKDPLDVIVNVHFTGICGSDVHYYTHGCIGKYVVDKPMVLGHESAGVVHAVGSPVKSLKVGDEVAMEPGVPCRRCVRCLEGNYNLCPDMAFAATPPYDGTLAKFYRMPEDFCYKLPSNVSMQEGAMLEPTAVAVHFCRLAKVSPGQKVVVFGVGPVGLLTCKVARYVFGATTVVGDGADVVIDASGAEPCIQTAIYVARNGGTFTQGGMGKTDITFPIGIMCGKELHVTGSFRYSAGDYQLALDMIASGKLSVKELISETVPFEQAKEAFDNVKRGNGIKWLIEGPKN